MSTDLFSTCSGDMYQPVPICVPVFVMPRAPMTFAIPEIHHLDDAVAITHQVAGLDIAMHDAGAMARSQCRAGPCLKSGIASSLGIGPRRKIICSTFRRR